MRPLAILKCIGKAVMKAVVGQVGLGVPKLVLDLAEDLWKEWGKQKEEEQRRAELQELVAMAAEDYRIQVEAVLKEVAAGQSAEVARQVRACLEEVRELAQQAFRRPEDVTGQSVPPEFSVVKGSDLVPFVSFRTLSPQGAAPRITIQYQKGDRAGTEEVIAEPTVLMFGRGKQCSRRLPADGHGRISRHHCLLEVVLPEVRLQDLGSLHGTFVNGELLGKRPEGKEPEPGFASADRELQDGDEVRLANQLEFRVNIHVPAVCAGCGGLIPDDEKAAGAGSNGTFMCSRCRAAARDGKKTKKRCAWCKGQATDMEANRPGIFICSDCRGNMRAIMQEMLGEAKAGQNELRAIRHYSLLEELGHGGMGAVYLARHDRTEQAAAIKLMLPQHAAADWAVERFEKEIRITMALRHRHVVRFLDHGYARGTFFMILEYCDAGSVDRLMEQRGGTLSVDEAGEIVLQALEGLDYAHQADLPFVKQKGGGYGPGKGIVHRDLKPGNLFLSGRGSNRLVKIGDFGLARAFDEAGLSGGTRTGARAGTWKFMCRQQVADLKNATAEVDVWAMAACLYYLLTGHAPRDFPKGKDPWWVILETKAVPIRERNAAIPRRVAELIDHALRDDPKIPFQSAGELKTALNNVL
jgi:serine/threonine-protein kinase